MDITPAHVTARLVFVVILVLLILFFAVVWALSWFRRHYLLEDEDEREEPPYTITQLREMYEDGIITGDEFERLRRKIYGRRPYLP